MTTPDEQRRRVGQTVEERMAELGITVTMLAEKAGVDPTTIRALIRGQRSPQVRTREKLATVLGWELGDVARRMSLEAVPTRDLLHELCRRADRSDL